MSEEQDEAPVEESRSVAVEVHHQQGGQMTAGASVSAAGAEHGSEELLRFVRDLQLAYQAAQMLVSTSFVPQSYSGKATEAAAAIVTGQGLGLDPLASLRSMDVIQGTPAFRAITIRAIVQAHGHDIWVEESTSHRAIVKGRRKGTDKVETSTWDMDRARGLNLLGKSNWKNQPGAMLVARATAEVGRLIAADALLGMAYSIEELEDGATPRPEEQVAPKPRATRTAAREPREVAAAPADAAPAEEPTPEPEALADGPTPAGDPLQMTPEELAEYGVDGAQP
ncbi:hypothetical protein [Microbacterium gilvum]|uniref:RecT-like ssDNA binding protein n=1 Tax=Microbacterium gilvum TaxID=1336204 RepID=A0ABP8ZPP3_9MICO